MGFREAVSTCFSKYLTFSGRASRSEFWFFFLFYNLATLAGFTVTLLTVTSDPDSGIVWPFFTILLFLLLPMLSVTARRLHDKGLTAWLLVLFVLPFGGIAILILCALPGDTGENAHGPGGNTEAAPEPRYRKSSIPTVKDRD
ncbi:MAG: DUF805 domain-containing protein [Pseudomonadota bacterium]